MFHYTELLYLALPAFIANMSPIVAAKINIWPRLAIPIDRGKKLRGKELLGKNKTVRGLFIGVLSGSCVAFIQHLLPFFMDVKFPHILIACAFGALAGLGALFGDALASLFKRQIGIPSGRPFIPFDQIDYIAGFFIFTLPLVHWSGRDIVFFLIFAIIANPLTNLTAYALGIKKTYW